MTEPIVLDSAYARAHLPRRDISGHKGDFGKVYLACGSVGYTGAPVFAARGAVRTGCGLVFLGVPQAAYSIVAAKCDCAMAHPLPDVEGRLASAAEEEILRRAADCNVLLLGCGLGRGAATDAVSRGLLRSAAQPVVLDADGINALAGHIDVLDARAPRVTILTPHDGEFARVGGDLSLDRAEGAARFAAAHRCFLVRKGHRTVVAAPDGTVLVNTTGNCGMAKGGSGDVLAGMIASLLAQGASPVDAAAVGVWLHGRAGDLAAAALTEYAMTPSDILQYLPMAFREIV